ncbi:MAG: hypothetical protein J3K34DRAFT_402372 [Monoraphidium minutum]|nr:MAG: hypothetical protein J3K34DRAFT_402372 [Monoraphidium minutum]
MHVHFSVEKKHTFWVRKAEQQSSGCVWVGAGSSCKAATAVFVRAASGSPGPRLQHSAAVTATRTGGGRGAGQRRAAPLAEGARGSAAARPPSQAPAQKSERVLALKAGAALVVAAVDGLQVDAGQPAVAAQQLVPPRTTAHVARDVARRAAAQLAVEALRQVSEVGPERGHLAVGGRHKGGNLALLARLPQRLERQQHDLHRRHHGGRERDLLAERRQLPQRRERERRHLGLSAAVLEHQVAQQHDARQHVPRPQRHRARQQPLALGQARAAARVVVAVAVAAARHLERALVRERQQLRVLVAALLPARRVRQRAAARKLHRAAARRQLRTARERRGDARATPPDGARWARRCKSPRWYPYPLLRSDESGASGLHLAEWALAGSRVDMKGGCQI